METNNGFPKGEQKTLAQLGDRFSVIEELKYAKSGKCAPGKVVNLPIQQLFTVMENKLLDMIGIVLVGKTEN